MPTHESIRLHNHQRIVPVKSLPSAASAQRTAMVVGLRFVLPVGQILGGQHCARFYDETDKLEQIRHQSGDQERKEHGLSSCGVQRFGVFRLDR